MAVGKAAHAPWHFMDPGALQLLDSSKLQLGGKENIIFTVFHLPVAHWIEGCADNRKHLYTCSMGRLGSHPEVPLVQSVENYSLRTGPKTGTW